MLIGTALEYSNVLEAWRHLLERAGDAYHGPDGRDRGLNELRRTFATRLCRAAEDAADALGEI